MMKTGTAVVLATTIILAVSPTGPAAAQAEWRYYGKSSWGCVALKYKGGDPFRADAFLNDAFGKWSYHDYRLKRYGKNYWGGNSGPGDYLDIRPKRRKAVIDYGTTASRRPIPRISKQRMRALCPAPM